MTGKNASSGRMIAVPSPKSGVVVSAGGSKKGRAESLEAEHTTKTLYKNHGGGCSSEMAQSHQAGEFVDKRNGNKGFIEEVNYKSSVKFDDKVEECTTEYEAQVKFKKVTTSNSNTSSYKTGRVAPAARPAPAPAPASRPAPAPAARPPPALRPAPAPDSRPAPPLDRLSRQTGPGPRRQTGPCPCR